MRDVVELSPETRVILLLCARFGTRTGTPAKPLTAAEFHRLAQWLQERGVSVGDLSRTDVPLLLRDLKDKTLDPLRLLELLNRTSSLARMAAKWARHGIWALSETDPGYPLRLRRRLKAAVSPLLFGAGPTQLLNSGGVCIVGSRDSGPAGLVFARSLGARCGREGMAVISSDMRGVDRQAITAALAAGGRVVSVLSDSLEKAVAAKRNRDALKARVIVLVTPFSPDTRFSVSNAMRANKYQYALSDRAVIVETRRKGGVWLGAEENRKHGWVPAFVRSGRSMSPGNRALLHLGLNPITQEDLDGCRSLTEVFSGRADGMRAAAGVATPPAPSDLPSLDRRASDLYAVFLAELEGLAAAKPQSEAEIMSHFGIERSQARAWLGRAVAEGRLSKSGRPARYLAQRL